MVMLANIPVPVREKSDFIVIIDCIKGNLNKSLILSIDHPVIRENRKCASKRVGNT